MTLAELLATTDAEIIAWMMVAGESDVRAQELERIWQGVDETFNRAAIGSLPVSHIDRFSVDLQRLIQLHKIVAARLTSEAEALEQMMIQRK